MWRSAPTSPWPSEYPRLGDNRRPIRVPPHLRLESSVMIRKIGSLIRFGLLQARRLPSPREKSKEIMPSNLKIVKILALVLVTVLTAGAQTGQVVLKSPNGALEISFATVRGQSV